METDFKVKTASFEGPLDLLLDMIEKRKLHISDISLSQVADDFIEHVRSIENFPMADSAEFILIASTLLLIKSKSLLPNLDLTEEEEATIEDLEERLRQYKKYKYLSQKIQNIFGNFLYFAKERRQSTVVFSPTHEITLVNLGEALRETLRNMPKLDKLPGVTVKKVVSLEDMIGKLSERIEKSLKTSFKEFAGLGKVEKVHVIVSFLAMLELVKQGAVRVTQENHFDDIEIESEKIGVPNY